MIRRDDSELQIQVRAARAETRSAFQNRAHMYAHILDELEIELGSVSAADTMRRAIFRRGLESGPRYRQAVDKGDLEEIGRLFVHGSPCQGTLFEPGIEEIDSAEGRIVLRMEACPLVDAWRDAGLPAERVDLLCRIAAAVDEGTFEGAGLDVEFLDRLGCPGSKRCLIELTLRDRT